MKHTHGLSLLVMAVLSLSLQTSCVKITDPPGTTPGPDADTISGTLTVTIQTSSLGGTYAPRNIVAIWIEDSTGEFVRTLGVRAGARIGYLSTWIASQGSSEVDGVTGATRSNHTGNLVVTWDGKDTNAAPMKKGTYVIRGELTDRNGSGATFSLPVDFAAATFSPPAFSAVPGFVSVVTAFTTP